VKDYPRAGFKDGVKKAMCGLCERKPETTYNNFVADFGEAYVEGYSRVGKKMMEALMATED